MAEGLVIAEVQGLLQAVAVLVSCYFIFNCNYPTGYKSFLVAVEKILLQVKASPGKVPTSIINILRKLTSKCHS